jgi:hypothetical protein
MLIFSFKSAEENFVFKSEEGVFFVPNSTNINEEDKQSLIQMSNEDDLNAYVNGEAAHNIDPKELVDIESGSTFSFLVNGASRTKDFIGAFIFKKGFIVAARKKDMTNGVIIIDGEGATKVYDPNDPRNKKYNEIFEKYSIKNLDVQAIVN